MVLGMPVPSLGVAFYQITQQRTANAGPEGHQGQCATTDEKLVRLPDPLPTGVLAHNVAPGLISAVRTVAVWFIPLSAAIPLAFLPTVALPEAHALGHP